jgi:predicted N-acyltransferase
MDFDIQIAHSVAEVGEVAWDRFSNGQPFASYRWYQFSETVMSDSLPVYIILSQHGEVVARATFWVVRNEPLPIPWQPARFAAQALLRRWPLFVCRTPLANSSGLILPEPPLRNPALEVIIRTATEEARRYKASFVLFDYLAEGQSLWSDWPKPFTAYSIADPGTRMEINWPSFDQYLEGLSRKTRQHYRQYNREAERLGIRIARHDTVSDIETALALIQEVDIRHNSSSSPWIRNMLENIGLAGGVWLTASVGDRLVGCELILEDCDTLMVTAFGLAQEFRHVYFLLGYADIQYAIEEGVRALRWGSGVFEVKQRLGFSLEDNNYLVFAATNPSLQLMGQWLGKMS